MQLTVIDLFSFVKYLLLTNNKTMWVITWNLSWPSRQGDLLAKVELCIIHIAKVDSLDKSFKRILLAHVVWGKRIATRETSTNSKVSTPKSSRCSNKFLQKKYNHNHSKSFWKDTIKISNPIINHNTVASSKSQFHFHNRHLPF